MRDGGVRSVVAGDTQYRRLQRVEEAVLGEPGGDLRTQTEGAVCLVHDDHPPDLAGGVHHSDPVDGREAAQVDDAEAVPVLGGGLGGVQAHVRTVGP